MKRLYTFLKKAYFLAYALLSILKLPSNRHARTVLLDVRDMHMQRRLYYLCFYLQKAGFHTRIAMSPHAVMNLNKYGIKAFGLPNTRLSLKRRVKHHLLIYHGCEPGGRDGTAAMELSVDVFSHLERDEVGPQDLFFPIAFHPYNLDRSSAEVLDRLRGGEKKVGLFFAGNIDPSKYNNEKTGALFHVLNRWEVVRAVLDSGELADRIVRPESYSQLRELMDRNALHDKIVICDTHSVPVPKDAWMETLARCRYFLAPPGVIQPYCHNIVEAMAVGSIPVSQLAGFYRPVLQDGQNALCFDDTEGLIKKIKAAFDEIGAEEEHALSAAAVEYYEKHFSPQAFREQMNAYIEAGNTHGKLILSHNKESVRLFEMHMDADPHE